MKKNILSLLLLAFSTICVFAKSPKLKKLPEVKSVSIQASMICFGWTNIYSNSTGQIIGRYSNNCWNAEFGSHRVTEFYIY